MKLFKTCDTPLLLCRLAVGIIFLSEGIQKIINPAEVGTGRFIKIGFAHAAFWAYFTSSFEIACGILIVIGLFTRLAVIPLLIIMIVAFVTTKIPVFLDKGFWSLAHEYRTDFAMTLLLIQMLLYGAGRNSLDQQLYSGKLEKW